MSLLYEGMGQGGTDETCYSGDEITRHLSSAQVRRAVLQSYEEVYPVRNSWRLVEVHKPGGKRALFSAPEFVCVYATFVQNRD